MRVKEYSVITYPTLGFNYIAIPKTGSSSFKTACYIAQGTVTEEHIKNNTDTWFKDSKKTLIYIKPAVAINNNLLNVSHFRHPVSRTISLYKDFVFGYKKDMSVSNSKSFHKDLQESRKRKNLKFFVDFFTAYPEEERNVHFRSQHWFVKDFLDANTFFFTTEKYTQGIQNLKHRGFDINVYYINKNTAPASVDVDIRSVEDTILQTHEPDLMLWEQYNV